MTRHAVVTGASSGIGWAIAAKLRADGWRVTGVARRADRLERLAAETGVETFVADLTQAADIEKLRAHLEANGPIDALINNAGGARGLERVEYDTVDNWRWMFEVNVLAVQQVTAALLPLLRAGARAGGSADIVMMTSIAAVEVYEGGAGYNAAKAAEASIARVLRLELAGEPIRIIEIAPGMVETEEFSTNRFGGDAARAAAVYRGVENPLTAEDVADVVAYSVGLPAHVNLDHVTIRPVAQPAQFKVIREKLAVRD